ncbi:MAG: hypothetical protein M3O22_08355 [Pseudomonadota bacterium]|nr:hypothetical protein [Pseudomonadota bacterium]
MADTNTVSRELSPALSQRQPKESITYEDFSWAVGQWMERVLGIKCAYAVKGRDSLPGFCWSYMLGEGRDAGNTLEGDARNAFEARERMLTGVWASVHFLRECKFVPAQLLDFLGSDESKIPYSLQGKHFCISVGTVLDTLARSTGKFSADGQLVSTLSA